MLLTATEGVTMTPRRLLGGMLIACLLTSGCSALRVSTSEQDSGPVAVGVGDGSPETANADAIPEGWQDVEAALGDECPIAIEFAADPRWIDAGGVSGYQVYANGEERLISINCYAWGGDGPESVTDEAMNVILTDPGSRVVTEKVGEMPGGVYWSVQGELGASSVRSIGGTESVFYGAVAGLRDEGRLYRVSVEMAAKKDDAEAAAVYALMLPTVRFAGNPVTPPPGLK